MNGELDEYIFYLTIALLLHGDGGTISMSMPPMEKVIEDAIRQSFACERCGNCCKGGGHAVLTAKDIEKLSRWLGMKRPDFLKHYAERKSPGAYWLKSQWLTTGPAEMERWCTFLEMDGHGLYRCRVNDAKPEQCRVFPAEWVNDDTLETCAGMKTLFKRISEDQEQEPSPPNNDEESEEAA